MISCLHKHKKQKQRQELVTSTSSLQFVRYLAASQTSNQDDALQPACGSILSWRESLFLLSRSTQLLASRAQLTVRYIHLSAPLSSSMQQNDSPTCKIASQRASKRHLRDDEGEGEEESALDVIARAVCFLYSSLQFIPPKQTETTIANERRRER